jgi:hypothetical protein
MLIREPTAKERNWIERLEERSSTSKHLLMKVAGKSVAVRIMTPGPSDELIDAAADLLTRAGGGQ